MNRINYLDGHRGIAIILVIMFHAYSRWPELIPYGNTYGNFPLFKYGYLGVDLFFMISGFVILMTLEKCNNAKEFIYKRWLRLFPAMLICSIITFCTSGFFSERPKGQPELKDLIPGLAFIEPYLWQKITGIPFQNIESSFWSLYVEFKFYVIAALLYFAIGGRKLVVTLFLCFIGWFSLSQLYQLSSNQFVYILYWMSLRLSFKYFGWFSAGASYYFYVKSSNKRWLYFGIIISLISSVIESHSVGALTAAVLISILFTASMISVRLQKIISNRFILYMGFVSYPLYLLHENMMISIVIKFNNYIYFIPNFLFPLIAIAFISAVSYFIANNVEGVIKKKISYTISRGMVAFKLMYSIR
jgi:peptidoglycan/LPS O-acetylase OafA/YrhL